MSNGQTKQLAKEYGAFLKSVEILPFQDRLNLKKSVGKNYEKMKHENAWISFMKTQIPESVYPSDENLAVLFYVAGLQAMQSMDTASVKGEKVLAQDALRKLYNGSSDSTKSAISSFFRYREIGNGRSLSKLNSFLKRTSSFTKLDLFMLLRDLLSWNQYDSVRMKWAVAIVKKDPTDLDSEEDSEYE